MLPLSTRVSSPPGASRQLGLLIWLDIDSATMVNRALQRDVHGSGLHMQLRIDTGDLTLVKLRYLSTIIWRL